MKVLLGIYTTLFSAPSSLFERTLSLVYEPLLSYLFNKPGNRVMIYQSSQMIKYMRRERGDYATLMRMLSKRGDVEHLSGSWSESVLSLLPPKDRGAQIEKLTSEIRHEYGVLPNSAFFYGELWQPHYVSLLNNAGIDNVFISTYSERNGGEISTEPFVMNELGKRVRIYPVRDSVSLAVREYADGKCDYASLRSRILTAVHEGGDGSLIFLNIDQLVLGAVREGKGSRPGLLLCDILDRVQTLSLSSVPVKRADYLPQGWYGRDGETFSLSSINSLFVKNEGFRYLYNRFITIAENAQTRNNRFLKKDVTTALFNTSMGNLFIYDSELAPLRYNSHRVFWRAILDAENCFWRDTEGPSMKEYDYEERGYSDYVMSNRNYLAVVSPRGASSPEFDFLPDAVNFFDTRSSWSDGDYSSSLRRSFEDRLVISGKEYCTSETLFSSEILDRKRTEIVFTSPASSSSPFVLTKRYKLKTNTFTLDTTVFPRGGDIIDGSYSLSIYLSFEDGALQTPEQRVEMFTTGKVEAKTVKYGSKEAGSSITISSTEPFTLTEESGSVRMMTGLGMEEFVIWRKLTFTFPLEVPHDESVTYRLNIRDNSNK